MAGKINFYDYYFFPATSKHLLQVLLNLKKIAFLAKDQVLPQGLRINRMQ
ncbi:hypothetical protein ACFLZQ_04515 [Thermodesulfobacteriota bacterium]